MPKIQKFPYLTPQFPHLSFGEWRFLHPDGEFRPLGTLLSNWDPATTLRASISTKINYLAVLNDCGFSNDVQLRMTTMWKSEGTFLKSCGEFVDIPPTLTEETTIELKVEINGINVSESIDLWVQLLLSQPGSQKSMPFVAKLPGSILAQSVPHKVIVEGEGPRFPVEIIDFSNTYYPSEAGWYLHWDPTDLFQSVLGTVRLYINAKHERVTKAVTLELQEDFDIRETIRYDVARALIYGAVANDEFVHNPDIFPTGSMGSAIRSMLRVYFPQVDFLEIRSKSGRQELFDADLQERLRIFQRDI